MIDQYFGVKELYEVVLRAKTPMQFGSRALEEGEPVLYFENISLAMLSEQNKPIIARGGWANLPRVIWENRSEVQFTISEGIMSSISMGILLSANVTVPTEQEPLFVSKREGPVGLNDNNCLFTDKWPDERKKAFIFEYSRDVAQKKMYGKKIYGITNPLDGSENRPCIQVYEDKELTVLADPMKQYIIDYYYQYDEQALTYMIQKERFKGLFTLEGKFYSKDENEGLNYTNVIYMPKVRIISDINLRLGERANPSVAVFNIIGLPENIEDKRNLILEINRLNQDIDFKDSI